MSFYDLCGQPCMYVNTRCTQCICVLCVCVPAGSASSAFLLVGPAGMERQHLHPSWAAGSGMNYFPLTDSTSVSNEHAWSAVYWACVCCSWTDSCCSAQGDQCAQHCSLPQGQTHLQVSISCVYRPAKGRMPGSHSQAVPAPTP